MFFFCVFFCVFARQRTKAQRSRHILRNSIHKTHLYLRTLLLKMSSAHTENLPADLNEHNEELADGCDNADTYLSAFYLRSFSFSLFSAFVMMRSEFLRKRRKEILVIIIVEIDDSLARMKRDNYLLFLRRATLFFHRETFFLAQKCVLFTFLARTSKVLLSSKHTSRAGFFSFRRIDDSR